jgi:hypothetical protein
VNFERVLKEVLWCLATEGSISYRRIRRGPARLSAQRISIAG